MRAKFGFKIKEKSKITIVKSKNGTEQHPGLGKAIKHLKNKSLKEKIRQEKTRDSKFIQLQTTVTF